MATSVILSAARTPIGALQGALAECRAPQLGAVAIRAAMERAGVRPEAIDEVFVGHVLGAGVGQAPGRQAALAGGVPNTVSVTTINKVCSSGLKAIMLADQAIRSGDLACAVAAGMESMTNAPFLLPKARAGLRLGHAQLLDSVIWDGLWDPYQDSHMGAAGELCAATHGFSREAQDAFALESYRRAQRAVQEGLFAAEIAPVAIPQRQGEPLMIAQDEEPGRVDMARFKTLRPAFAKDGTITAGNASSISDGAAALVIASETQARMWKMTPLARIVASATASQAPEWFTTAPAAAITKVCRAAGCEIKDIDLFEINEAFACVTMHAVKTCGIDPERVNVHGGAIALGHPLGASGARIVVTLLHALQQRGQRRGLATLCNGGGEATAVIVECV